MTHRERAMTAIDHKEPDRVPIDLGGTGGLIVDSVYFEVCRLLGLNEKIEPYRSGSSANYYDERILDTFDVDFRHVWLASPDKPKSLRHPDGTVTDDWGITWSAEGSYPVCFPLQGKPEQEIMGYQWPDPKNWDTSALRERARYLYEKTDYAIIAKAVQDGGGVFERSYYLRTMDDLFVDFFENEDMVFFIINKIADIEIQLWDMFLDAVGPYVQIVQRATDLGTQTGLFISPDLFRKFFKPAEDRIYRFIKSKAPHVKIWFHSCGAIEPLINDFLDLGIDILNPVQPLCTGMDSLVLKKKYGDRLCFHGGIDLQKALPGTKEDTIAEVKRRIQAFAPGGGYILAPANHIQKDTAGENVIALYEYAKKFGAYPIE
jgi:uroporphyrinogen decarboxylase